MHQLFAAALVLIGIVAYLALAGEHQPGSRARWCYLVIAGVALLNLVLKFLRE